MKNKVFPNNCQIERKNSLFKIVIIDNKYIISINDGKTHK